jgi:D-ribose pyranose/furanose isomerase RbsD
MPINFVIWQFVRLMVCLEQQTSEAGEIRKESVLSAWAEIWQELDNRLAELGETDAAAYADLMIEQEVIIDEISAAQIDEVVDVVDVVSEQITAEVAQIKRSISEQPKEGKEDTKLLLESLEYELGELKNLKNELQRRRQSPSGDTFH